MAALGVTAVVVAAAGVLQFVPDGDAVHDTAAALGQIDDPRRKRIAIGIIGLLAILPAHVVNRRLLRLHGPPTFRVELSVTAAGSPHPHVLRVFEKLRLTIGAKIVLLEFPWSADADAAVAALGSSPVFLDACDDRV